MSKSYETMKLFYQNLGKLFYAVAYADDEVSEEEIKELQKVIEKVWVPLEDTKDEFGIDNAFTIGVMFQYLNETKESAKTCFDDFKKYASENRDLFTNYVKYITIDTAIEIANSFSETDEVEKEMIDDLARFFNNLD